MSHGNYDNTPFICTNENATEEKQRNYSTYLENNDIEIYDGCFWIKPSFFENNYNNDLQDSLILMSCCKALGENNHKDYSFANSFDKAGAGAVIGYCNTVVNLYSNSFFEKVIYYITQNYSIGDAYVKSLEIIGKDDNEFYDKLDYIGWEEQPAYPVLYADNQSDKFIKNPLENKLGGFSAIVKDKITDNPLENVSVAIYELNDSEQNLMHFFKTDYNGTFFAELPNGKYKCIIHKNNYKDIDNITFEIKNCELVAFLDPILMESDPGSAHGTIIDSETRESISNVKVTLYSEDTQATYTTVTDEIGDFSFENLTAGRYTLSFEHEDYTINETNSFTLDEGLMFVFTEPFEFAKKSSSGEDNSGDTGDDDSGTDEPAITVIDSGNCGADGSNVTWILYSNGELVINGNGSIMTEENGYSPFSSYSNSIKTIKISNTITSIGSYAFSNLKKLTTVNLPDSITKIGNGAFRNCKSLTDITIGSSLTSIPDYAFLGCESLVNISIPNSVTSIGYESFEDCKSLKNIIIGSGVKSIGESTHTAGCNAFANCTSLTDITVDKNNKNYSSDSGVLFNKDKTELIQYPIGNTRTTYIIPETVTSISNYAFSQCSNLTNIIIGSRVKSIEYSAFSGCDNLISVEIPNNVTEISLYAFAYCNSLTNITLGSNVATIYHNSFLNCPNLKYITVNEGNEYYSCSEGILFNYDKSELVQYPIGDTRTSYTIPDSVTTIGSSAFAYCYNLTSITIPDNVKRIGSEAFSYSSGLTEITIPSSVATIDLRAFCYCNSLISVTIGNGIINNSTTSIENYAFAWCDNLEKVIIGNNVKQIDNYAFYMCESLVDVTIGDSVTIIGENAFAWCDNLKSVTIPKSITTISYNAFGYCDNLSDVYYTGTKSQWDNISISGSNSDLLNATIHYNS